jgi:hypothetical protein
MRVLRPPRAWTISALCYIEPLQRRLLKTPDQVPLERFEASDTYTLIFDPPSRLAQATQIATSTSSKGVPYCIECGITGSTFHLVGKKWTGLPLLKLSAPTIGGLLLSRPISVYGRGSICVVVARPDMFRTTLVTAAPRGHEKLYTWAVVYLLH